MVDGFGGSHVHVVSGFPMVGEVHYTPDMLFADVVDFVVVHYIHDLVVVCYDGSDVDGAHYGFGSGMEILGCASDGVAPDEVHGDRDDVFYCGAVVIHGGAVVHDEVQDDDVHGDNVVHGGAVVHDCVVQSDYVVHSDNVVHYDYVLQHDVVHGGDVVQGDDILHGDNADHYFVVHDGNAVHGDCVGVTDDVAVIVDNFAENDYGDFGMKHYKLTG